MHVVLVLCTWLGVASAGASAPTASDESFDEVYRRGHETAAGITTLTARFTETTESSLLTRPLVARGTLAVQRPNRAVLRFTEPEARVIVIDGDRMTMVWPSRKVTRLTNVASTQSRIQKYLGSASASELRRQFDVGFQDAAARPDTYEVTLTPKRARVRDSLKQLVLWVDRTSLMLTALRMTYANGDTKTMEFDEVMPNAVVEPRLFSVER